jgi:hypothetical protein
MTHQRAIEAMAKAIRAERGLFGKPSITSIQQAEAALAAYREYLAAEGFIVVPKSALDWLFGEGPDADGKWFEPPEIKDGERKKPYWWRSRFRAMITAAQQEQNDAGE